MDDNEKPANEIDDKTNLTNGKNLQDIMEGMQKIMEDPEKQKLLSVFKKLMDNSANENSDPRFNLLNAIKPFLKPKRQKTLDSFKQYYTYLNVIKTQDELSKINKQEGEKFGL